MVWHWHIDGQDKQIKSQNHENNNFHTKRTNTLNH
jgi:hypothetical protein